MHSDATREEIEEQEKFALYCLLLVKWIGEVVPAGMAMSFSLTTPCDLHVRKLAPEATSVAWDDLTNKLMERFVPVLKDFENEVNDV